MKKLFLSISIFLFISFIYATDFTLKESYEEQRDYLAKEHLKTYEDLGLSIFKTRKMFFNNHKIEEIRLGEYRDVGIEYAIFYYFEEMDNDDWVENVLALLKYLNIDISGKKENYANISIGSYSYLFGYDKQMDKNYFAITYRK